MWSVCDSCRTFSSDLALLRRLALQTPPRAPPPPLERSAGSAWAPRRRDVPLLDPCSGLLSAGSGASLSPFIHSPQLSSAPRACSSAPRTVSLSLDTSPEKDWNSRRVSGSALRARAHADPDAAPPRHVTAAVSAAPKDSPHPPEALSPEAWVTEAVRHFTYTSATQRGYEEVNWDGKLPRRLKPPASSLEKMADAVTDRPSTRRHHERAQPWQSLGAEWNRQQLRVQEDVRKPVSFCSPCRRSGQIPSYTGSIGSRNIQDIDDPDKDFSPISLRRSQQPPPTPTARRLSIPGHRGRGLHAAAPPPVQSSGSGLRRPSWGRCAPLSRTVTSSSRRGNPFNTTDPAQKI